MGKRDQLLNFCRVNNIETPTFGSAYGYNQFASVPYDKLEMFSNYIKEEFNFHDVLEIKLLDTALIEITKIYKELKNRTR